MLAGACGAGGAPEPPSPRAARMPVAALTAHERMLAARAFTFVLQQADSLAPRCLELQAGTSEMAPDSALLAAIGSGERVHAGRGCPMTYQVMGGYVDPITGEAEVKPAPRGYRDPVIVRLSLPLSDTLVRVRRTQGTLGYEFKCANPGSGLSCTHVRTILH